MSVSVPVCLFVCLSVPVCVVVSIGPVCLSSAPRALHACVQYKAQSVIVPRIMCLVVHTSAPLHSPIQLSGVSIQQMTSAN